MKESVSPTERAIKWSTAVAVICVATVAAVVSYDHAYALVRTYGEDGWTARLVPLTVDGLIYASSMVLLHSARRGLPVPPLARWLLGVGILATLAANAAHGLGHGPVGAVVAAWLAVALVGTYELLMLIIRRTGRVSTEVPEASPAVPQLHLVPVDVSERDPLQVQAAEDLRPAGRRLSAPSVHDCGSGSRERNRSARTCPPSSRLRTEARHEDRPMEARGRAAYPGRVARHRPPIVARVEHV